MSRSAHVIELSLQRAQIEYMLLSRSQDACAFAWMDGCENWEQAEVWLREKRYPEGMMPWLKRSWEQGSTDALLVAIEADPMADDELRRQARELRSLLIRRALRNVKDALTWSPDRLELSRTFSLSEVAEMYGIDINEED